MSTTQTTTASKAGFELLCIVADRCLDGLSQNEARTEAAATSMSPVSPSSSINSNHEQPTKPRSRPPKNRETHNKKEKQRRDNMRSQLNGLRSILNTTTGQEGDFSKASVLNLLKSTTTKIKELKGDGLNLNAYNEMLKERNRILRSQLGLVESNGGHFRASPLQIVSGFGAGEVDGDDVDINVTDNDDETDHGSQISDSSRLQALMCASVGGDGTPPPSLPVAMCSTAAAPPRPPVDMAFPAHPHPVQSHTLYNVARDIANAGHSSSGVPFVFPSSLIQLGLPAAAQTSSYTSFNVPPQFHQQFITGVAQAHAS